MHYIYVHPKADNLLHGTKQKIVMKKTKTKNRDAQKKRSSHKAMESVLRWERFVKEVGLEPGVKERGSYGS